MKCVKRATAFNEINGDYVLFVLARVSRVLMDNIRVTVRPPYRINFRLYFRAGDPRLTRILVLQLRRSTHGTGRIFRVRVMSIRFGLWIEKNFSDWVRWRSCISACVTFKDRVTNEDCRMSVARRFLFQ